MLGETQQRRLTIPGIIEHIVDAIPIFLPAGNLGRGASGLFLIYGILSRLTASERIPPTLSHLTPQDRKTVVDLSRSSSGAQIFMPSIGIVTGDIALPMIGLVLTGVGKYLVEGPDAKAGDNALLFTFIMFGVLVYWLQSDD